MKRDVQQFAKGMAFLFAVDGGISRFHIGADRTFVLLQPDEV